MVRLSAEVCPWERRLEFPHPALQHRLQRQARLEEDVLPSDGDLVQWVTMLDVVQLLLAVLAVEVAQTLLMRVAALHVARRRQCDGGMSNETHSTSSPKFKPGYTIQLLCKCLLNG